LYSSFWSVRSSPRKTTTILTTDRCILSSNSAFTFRRHLARQNPYTVQCPVVILIFWVIIRLKNPSANIILLGTLIPFISYIIQTIKIKIVIDDDSTGVHVYVFITVRYNNIIYKYIIFVLYLILYRLYYNMYRCSYIHCIRLKYTFQIISF